MRFSKPALVSKQARTRVYEILARATLSKGSVSWTVQLCVITPLQTVKGKTKLRGNYKLNLPNPSGRTRPWGLLSL
jgi:hypothetical protein